MHIVACMGCRVLLACRLVHHNFWLFDHKHGLLGQAQNTTDFFGGSHFDGIAVERAGTALFNLFDLFLRQTSTGSQIGQSPSQFFAAHA